MGVEGSALFSLLLNRTDNLSVSAQAVALYVTVCVMLCTHVKYWWLQVIFAARL